MISLGDGIELYTEDELPKDLRRFKEGALLVNEATSQGSLHFCKRKDDLQHRFDVFLKILRFNYRRIALNGLAVA